MPKKKTQVKRVRRKIRETSNPVIAGGDLTSDEIGLISEKPRGRELVEQDLSNILTSVLPRRDEIFMQESKGDKVLFSKVFPSDGVVLDERVAIVPESLLEKAFKTIVELDQSVDFLRKQVEGKKAPTLKRALASHKRKLTKLNKKRKSGKKNAAKI